MQEWAVTMIAYMHEIEHIKNGDYDKHCSVDLIELAAHRISLNPECNNIPLTEDSKCMGKVIDKIPHGKNIMDDKNL